MPLLACCSQLFASNLKVLWALGSGCTLPGRSEKAGPVPRPSTLPAAQGSHFAASGRRDCPPFFCRKSLTHPVLLPSVLQPASACVCSSPSASPLPRPPPLLSMTPALPPDPSPLAHPPPPRPPALPAVWRERRRVRPAVQPGALRAGHPHRPGPAEELGQAAPGHLSCAQGWGRLQAGSSSALASEVCPGLGPAPSS